jgi:hypothetical protein
MTNPAIIRATILSKFQTIIKHVGDAVGAGVGGLVGGLVGSTILHDWI